MRFPPVGLIKPMELLEPFLVYVITLVRPTNTSTLVEIGFQGAPPHSGEISQFCDSCSPTFFRFLISPTGCNSVPIHTFDSSNDVLCLVYVPFWGLEPSISLLGGSPSRNYQNFDSVLDFADLQRNRFSIGAP